MKRLRCLSYDEYNGFIADPWAGKDQAHIESLNTVSSVTEATGFTESEYKVSTVEDLVKLAELTNAGVDTTGKTFYLTSDLDLGAYCDSKMATGGWTPIGDKRTINIRFNGAFDGNGHVIKNLKIVRETSNYQGLFGDSTGATLTNIAMINAEVKGKDYVGILSGENGRGSIINCYVVGEVFGQNNIGGMTSLVRDCTDCYAIANVTGQNKVGGFIGDSNSGVITNSFATGDVTGQSFVGGFAGEIHCSISNSYATGDVTGQSFVGGLAGQVYATYGTYEITNSASYSRVNGADSSSTGSLIGGAVMTSNGTSFGTLNISNTLSRPIDGMNKIGGAFKTDNSAITFDLSSQLAGISDVKIRDITTNLQVGIYGDNSCQINFDTNFAFDLSAIGADISSDSALKTIDDFINQLSEQETKLGAVQNRLESALESITVNIENLTSSRSTIRDADIAEVSSHYIQQQILQQASATLMATANQSPAIALQLI